MSRSVEIDLGERRCPIRVGAGVIGGGACPVAPARAVAPVGRKIRRDRLRLILPRGIGEAVMEGGFDPGPLHETPQTGREAA